MTSDMSPCANGRGSESWSRSHLGIDRRSPGYCRVTFDHPPINPITATIVADLAELVGLIEQDPDSTSSSSTAPTPISTWPTTTWRTTRPGPRPASGSDRPPRGARSPCASVRAPVVSIAAIRGRARGAGSEFVLACDLRFPSRENTLLGQFAVGTGLVPGGGPMARLSRLVGRGRALEILLVADDLDGPRAEQYGYVNRAIADDQLDDEVDRIASRLARFDHDAIARTKSHVDHVTLPADSEFAPAWPISSRCLGAPRSRQIARLEALALNVDSDLERRLGQRVVEALPDA
jgi:enoyl-CoA hydratase/carnithine racemase